MPVELLLRKDVPKLGLVGDLVKVSEGYARNYLIPHHLALVPNKANLKIIEVEKKKAAEERARRHEFLRQMAAKMAATELHISAAANEEGHLYGSVGPRDVSRALMAEGFSVHPDEVRMDEPLKKLDTVMVKVRLADDIETEVKVWVVPEKTVGDLSEYEHREDRERDTDVRTATDESSAATGADAD